MSRAHSSAGAATVAQAPETAGVAGGVLSLIIDGDFGARELRKEEEEERGMRASSVMDERDSLGRKPAIRYDDDDDDDDSDDGGEVR